MASTAATTNASAALAATIEEELCVIHLTTPMTLAPNKKIIATCSSNIKFALEQFPELSTCVSAIFPTTITTTSRTHLTPNGALGKWFVRGWSALPEELRLRVLHFNLISEREFVDYLSPHFNGQRRNLHQVKLFQFMSMGPEIASLVPEAYYKANKFVIVDANHYSNPFLPPNPVRRWITSVALVVSLSQGGWDTLKRLVVDGWGLENLRFVEVRFFVSSAEIGFIQQHLNRIVQDPDACRVQFRCSGCLEFEREPLHFGPKDQLAKINWTIEGVEERVRKVIQFTA